MNDFSHADFYTDRDLHADPHAYFDFLRAKGTVTRLPDRNAVAVTGYEETVQVMLDTEHFSSINAVTGALTKLPFEPAGDDISEQLEAMRSKIAFADQVVTEQGKRHADLRSVLSALFTPSRLKALEAKLRDPIVEARRLLGEAGRVVGKGAAFGVQGVQHTLLIEQDGILPVTTESASGPGQVRASACRIIPRSGRESRALDPADLMHRDAAPCGFPVVIACRSGLWYNRAIPPSPLQRRTACTCGRA